MTRHAADGHSADTSCCGRTRDVDGQALLPTVLPCVSGDSEGPLSGKSVRPFAGPLLGDSDRRLQPTHGLIRTIDDRPACRSSPNTFSRAGDLRESLLHVDSSTGLNPVASATSVHSIVSVQLSYPG
jgi:hypothetical protein